MTLKSTSSGTASLLDEAGGVSMTGTGTIKAERYLVKNSWHLISPATTGVTANNFYWNDAPKCWLMYHTESTNALTYNTSLATSMPVGQGWLVWIDNNTTTNPGATATMTGSLRTSPLSPTVTRSGLGWNLTGNPYPCAIDWQSGTWTRTNLELTVWIWNNATNNYVYRTTSGGGDMSNGIIPQGQGFFVKANAASPELSVPADARLHSSQAFYKSGEQISGYTDYLVLTGLCNNQSDQVWISFGPEGTDGFDNGWDASKLTGGETAPQLWLAEEEREQSIDHLFTLGNQERIVKLNYKVGTSGIQQITNDMTHFEGKIVILDDLVTGQSTTLNPGNPYLFTGYINDNTDRFRLRFRHALGIEPSGGTAKQLQILGGEDKIIIHSNGLAATESGLVKIFDLTGRMLLEKPVPAEPEVEVPVSQAGLVIVTVIKDNSKETGKIFVR
jgi:hypothetical protein